MVRGKREKERYGEDSNCFCRFSSLFLFEHALMYKSLHCYSWTLSSFFDAVRLNESSYSVKNLRDDGYRMDELSRIVGFTGAENSCLPSGIHNLKKPETNEELRPRYSGKGNHGDAYSRTLSGRTIYVDSDISADLRNKVSSNHLSIFFFQILSLSESRQSVGSFVIFGHCTPLSSPTFRRILFDCLSGTP